jgi:hypothetical protein
VLGDTTLGEIEALEMEGTCVPGDVELEGETEGVVKLALVEGVVVKAVEDGDVVAESSQHTTALVCWLVKEHCGLVSLPWLRTRRQHRGRRPQHTHLSTTRKAGRAVFFLFTQLVLVHARWPVTPQPKVLDTCISADVHKRPFWAAHSVTAEAWLTSPAQVGPGVKYSEPGLLGAVVPAPIDGVVVAALIEGAVVPAPVIEGAVVPAPVIEGAVVPAPVIEGEEVTVVLPWQHSRPCDCVPSNEHWGLVSPPDPSATHTAGRLGFLEFWQDEEVHTRFVLSWQGSPERLPATISLRVHKRPPWLAH